MIDERDVREMLQRRVNAVDAGVVDAPRATRRARRRLVANGAVAVVAAAAIALATFAGVEAIRTAPVPADDGSERLGIFAPVAGRILYLNKDDVGYDAGLWAVDPSGPADTAGGPSVAPDVVSTLVQLRALDADPIGWSSDGTDLLLMRSDGDELFSHETLSILHADGSETRLNTEPMSIAGASIAPDGSRVVFAAQGDHLGLYVVDAGGGPPVRLRYPTRGDLVSSPTFSPDGTRIAYLVGGDHEERVWIANADGSDAHEILADERTVIGGVSGLQWSPRGDRLAIGIGDFQGSGGPAIYTFAPDGSDFTQVIADGVSPFWSPDGSRIAYTIPCGEQPTASCPEGSLRRAEFETQPGRAAAAGLAIADADGSNVRAFGFATSGPWAPVGAMPSDGP